MAFSRQFGELEVTYQKGRKRRLRAEFADASNLGSDGELLAPERERAKYNRANQLWHSDASFRAIPSKYSLLYAETVKRNLRMSGRGGTRWIPREKRAPKNLSRAIA